MPPCKSSSQVAFRRPDVFSAERERVLAVVDEGMEVEREALSGPSWRPADS